MSVLLQFRDECNGQSQWLEIEVGEAEITAGGIVGRDKAYGHEELIRAEVDSNHWAVEIGPGSREGRWHLRAKPWVPDESEVPWTEVGRFRRLIVR